MTLRGHFFVLLGDFCYHSPYVSHGLPYIMESHAPYPLCIIDGDRSFYSPLPDSFRGYFDDGYPSE